MTLIQVSKMTVSELLQLAKKRVGFTIASLANQEHTAQDSPKFMNSKWKKGVTKNVPNFRAL
jgi:hypothetical protein